jgi:hypothetical protein
MEDSFGWFMFLCRKVGDRLKSDMHGLFKYRKVTPNSTKSKKLLFSNRGKPQALVLQSPWWKPRLRVTGGG